MNSRRKRIGDYGNYTYKLMLTPALLLLLVIGVIPVFAVIIVSMLNWDLTSTISPQFIGVQNFIDMIYDKRFLNSLWIQVIFSTLILVVQLSFGLLAAISLNKLSNRWKWIRGAVMAPLVIPPVVVALIWLTLYTPTISPINSALELIGINGPSWLTTPFMAVLSLVVADTWAGFPFVMIILLAALQAIPSDMYEAASLDGAKWWDMFIHITLPYLKQALILAGMFRLIESLKSFPLVYVLTGGGPGTSTEVTNFYAYLQGFEYSYISYASALAFVIFLVTIIITFVITSVNKIQ